MPNVVSFSFEVKDGETAITPCSVMMGKIHSHPHALTEVTQFS